MPGRSGKNGATDGERWKGLCMTHKDMAAKGEKVEIRQLIIKQKQIAICTKTGTCVRLH